MKEGIDMTIHKSKPYKKLDAYSQKSINLAIDKLRKRYEEYRKQNIVITNLFGDDIIIHDIIESNFYVYKCQTRGIQIRLLYEVDKKDKINVIDYYIKNQENTTKTNVGKQSTRYVAYFQKAVSNYKEENA